MLREKQGVIINTTENQEGVKFRREQEINETSRIKVQLSIMMSPPLFPLSMTGLIQIDYWLLNKHLLIRTTEMTTTTFGNMGTIETMSTKKIL